MSAILAPVPAPHSTPLPPDAASSAALTALYTAALGHGPKDRYLRRFTLFDAAGRTLPGWNWAASLYTVGWVALRNLWVPALLYVAVLEGLALLALGPGRWLLPQEMYLPALLVIAALAWLLPGIYGDALLHTEIRKRIVTAVTQTQSVAEACTFLSHSASNPHKLKKLILANTAMAVALATVATLYVWQPWNSMSSSAAPRPASTGQDNTTRPELTVQEALAEASSAAIANPHAIPAPQPAPQASAESGLQPGYYLNVGLFTDEASARKVQAELLNANLPAFRQPLETVQGQRIRVRVGPFATLQQAQIQRKTLRAMGLEAVVSRQ